VRRSGCTGDEAEADTASYGILLVVESLAEAKKGLVLLPRLWVVDRSYGWMARFRRLAREYERLGETLEGQHYVAFSMLMLHKAAAHFHWSS
jgi:transposase